MVWKCPPLHLPNWNNLWKWKQEMNAYELADDAKNISNAIEALEWVQKAVPMLRQQQAEIEELKAKLGCDPAYFDMPARKLTDMEIMEIFTAYEEMQEYGYVGKKPFNVHLGWSLKDISQCLMLARAILRKAQEK